MKAIITALSISLILISCNKEDSPINETSFNISVSNLSPQKTDLHPNTAYVYLFDANNTEYPEQQDIKGINNLFAVNSKGEKVKASFALIAHDGFLSSTTKPGKYFIVVVLQSTWRYTSSYTTIGNTPVTLTKVFKQSLPNSSFESWN